MAKKPRPAQLGFGERLALAKGDLWKVWGLGLAGFGFLGLMVAIGALRGGDWLPPPDCDAMKDPAGSASAIVVARLAEGDPRQTVRLNRQVCLAWRPALYFKKEIEAKKSLTDLVTTAKGEERDARKALSDAQTATPANATDLAAKKALVQDAEKKRIDAETQLAALPSSKSVVLFMDGVPTPVGFEAPIPEPTTAQGDVKPAALESLPLKLNGTNNAKADGAHTWREVLAVDPSGSRPVQMALGDAGSKHPRAGAFTTLVTLEVFSFWWLLLGGLSLILMMGGLVTFGWQTRMLRDSSDVAADLAPFSLGRTQLAFWLMLVVGGFTFIWLVTGQYIGVFTTSIVALLGISGVSSAAAAVVDTTDAAAQATAAAQPHAADRPAANAPQARESRGFINDVLSDGEGNVVLHRVQMAIWSMILGIIFLATVLRSYAFPEFDEALVVLAGVVGGLYVGLKIPEKA